MEGQTQPQGFDAGLKLFDSITKKVVPFRPASGKLVKWYICGPTTYDSSHLGHARNYITFDIIRRILEDYFGYEVFYVMNITDVDDKIILKARRSFLYKKYRDEHKALDETVKKDLKEAHELLIQTLEGKIAKFPKERNQEAENELALLSKKLETAKTALAHFSKVAEQGTQDGAVVSQLLDDALEALSILLDNRHGSSLTDQKIFRDTASIYEREFFEDMKNLGVRFPDVLTRVTEYIPEVVDFVKKIIDNGFGYASNGSVYFDTAAFKAKHGVGKLDPGADAEKLSEEGEGELSKGTASEKKNKIDFALWKKSKPGEPFWDSPWGQGRPGWHIECSAMAGSILGSTMDIHSGGEDLKFPHHNNEILQSEAYYDCSPWVQYFLHSGHLHIDGLKMSKSLKNFITIRQALQSYSPRQIRLLFITKPWNNVMNYTQAALNEIKTKEKTINEFFLTVRNLLRDQKDLVKLNQKWTKEDTQLHNELLSAQEDVDKHLKDNFNTPEAFNRLMQLINKSNAYIKSLADQSELRKGFLLRKAAVYISRILRVFGVVPDQEFGLGGDDKESGGATREEILAPYLDAFVDFRQQVRKAAKEKKEPVHFLQLSDEIRDKTCPPLGLRLEDDTEVLQRWKLVDAAELVKELEEKKKAAAEIKRKKLVAKIEGVEREVERLKEWSKEPKSLFSAEEYSKFDDKGVPTHDKDGAELTKGKKKKVEGEFNSQKKNHEKYLEALNKDPQVIQNKLAEIDKLKVELNEL